MLGVPRYQCQLWSIFNHPDIIVCSPSPEYQCRCFWFPLEMNCGNHNSVFSPKSGSLLSLEYRPLLPPTGSESESYLKHRRCKIVEYMYLASMHILPLVLKQTDSIVHLLQILFLMLVWFWGREKDTSKGNWETSGKKQHKVDRAIHNFILKENALIFYLAETSITAEGSAASRILPLTFNMQFKLDEPGAWKEFARQWYSPSQEKVKPSPLEVPGVSLNCCGIIRANQYLKTC